MKSLNIDGILRNVLAPPSSVVVDAGVEQARARLQAQGAGLVWRSAAEPRSAPRMVAWLNPLAAFAMILAIGVGIWVGTSLRTEAIAMLEAADLSVYRVVNGRVTPMRTGDRIAPRETVRAVGPGSAVLSLVDGAKVEMRPQSELTVDRSDKALTIHLNTGSIIVNAATREDGRLYVRAKDVTVSAEGAVSVVSAVADGAHIGAIQGEVRVREVALERRLRPGEQVSTDLALTPEPLQDAIAWSPNRDVYALMLGKLFAKGMAQTAAPLTSLREAAPLQAPVVRPASTFEVASVRLCDPATLSAPPAGARGGGGGSIQMTPGRLRALCMTVATLIRTAYGLRTRTGDALNLDFVNVYGLGEAGVSQVRGGPDWVRNDRYTIEAVGDDKASAQTLSGPMLRDLLERRFQLTAHKESEPVSGFALTVAPGGLKMIHVEAGACTPRPPADAGGPPPPDLSMLDRLRQGETPMCDLSILPSGANLVLIGGAIPVAPLVQILGQVLGGRVIDGTNVPDSDRFNFVLEFVPDERTAGPLGGRGRRGVPAPADTGTADLFTALKEQLGLRLGPAHIPREYIVIDRVERPSPN